MAHHSIRRWTLLSLLGLAACAGEGPKVSTDAAKAAQQEAELLQRFNDARGSRGLAPLQMSARLVTVARDRSARLAAHQQVGPNQTLAQYPSAAESLGSAVSVAYLQRAFWSSPEHQAKILGDYNYVGIGAVSSAGGSVWITVDFVKTEEPLASAAGPRTDEGPIAALLAHRAAF